MATICDEFPHFLGWPPQKVYFLENMACRQDESTYVVITKEMDEEIGIRKCMLCYDRLRMDFNQEIEEWVFNDCKKINGVVYHYPNCYEEALKLGNGTTY